MTAVRGTYNKSSQRIPLTDDQLETLAKGFIEHRKTVPCPHCKIPTVFRTKGKSKATNHEKEHEYICTVCSRIMHADDMLALVTCWYDMEEDSQLPAIASQPQVTSTQPQLPSPFPPQLEMGATPDMQTLFQMHMTLTTELQQARTEIANLKEQLNGKQQHQPHPVSPITLEDDFPALPVSKYQSAPWHQPQKVLSLAQIVSKNQEKREATAARSYSLGKLRTTFKKLGVNNGRLLDLHYPDRNIVAVLVHNDYAPELTELLTKKGVKFNTTFDPCAASVLKDPKYATDSLEQRQQIAQQLHNQRVQKALVHIRGPAKFAVAGFFAHKSWITKTQLDEVLATDPYFAHSKDPETEDILSLKTMPPLVLLNPAWRRTTPYYEFSMSGVPLRISLFHATGLPKQYIYPLINIAQNSSLLFITETWLLSPNKYSLPSWKQFHSYDVPVNSYNLHRGQLGLALLVNPDFKLPIHHINHVNPLLAKFTLSIIINFKLLIHCLYLPPSLESAQVSEILSLLPLDYPTTNKTIICGDFNSRIGELVGDSRWNTSGRIFRNWMEAHNLILWNQYLAFGQPTSYTYHGTIIEDELSFEL
ncbi:hypothetical protein G6F29_000219 [Rhizopus arrhizus]|nr:hypothetical protein G6F20_011516 [Rhizopus arrhizus]KAG0840875.1 hypothetical protein G6F19_001846 [Rhizopus arrhizus]KAG0848801.1 hypothetical protein G6F17_011333 [Rhizopus arrhizus]KAG0902375.1 hypothetical protein G6F34_002100 [Rhizopus arrhizus]KAG0949597.1 hypothetical protein G6F30_002159 [Rhizopus arrhizus]